MLLVYAHHFAPELLQWSSSQKRRMPRTFSEKAAAVLDYALTAQPPDDPPTQIPGPVIVELHQGTSQLAEGFQAAGSGSIPEKLEEAAVCEADADAEGWEVLSRAASSAAEAGTSAASLASEEDELAFGMCLSSLPCFLLCHVLTGPNTCGDTWNLCCRGRSGGQAVRAQAEESSS